MIPVRTPVEHGAEIDPPGIVLDCMVFLQAAARENGPAFACLEVAEAGLATLYMSPEILAEVQDVLSRRNIRRKLPSLTDERVEQFLEYVAGFAVVRTDIPRVFSLHRDPKDDPYVNLAAAVGARFLVSRDNDLLDLMKSEDEDAVRFRAGHPELMVIDPARFIAAIAGRGELP
jgi:putative PIN family toxin of toxin-antitoxin system